MNKTEKVVQNAIDNILYNEDLSQDLVVNGTMVKGAVIYRSELVNGFSSATQTAKIVIKGSFAGTFDVGDQVVSEHNETFTITAYTRIRPGSDTIAFILLGEI